MEKSRSQEVKKLEDLSSFLTIHSPINHHYFPKIGTSNPDLSGSSHYHIIKSSHQSSLFARFVSHIK